MQQNGMVTNDFSELSEVTERIQAELANVGGNDQFNTLNFDKRGTLEKLLHDVITFQNKMAINVQEKEKAGMSNLLLLNLSAQRKILLFNLSLDS